MYSLNEKDFRYTAAERTKIMSSILLPPTLLSTIDSEFRKCSGADLLLNVKEGKLDNYLINWLDFPEKCFNSSRCTVVLRRDRMNKLPSYALITAGDTNENA